MESKVKSYKVIIWIRGSDEPGTRVEILAENMADARARLKAEYGEEATIYLTNDEEAS